MSHAPMMERRTLMMSGAAAALATLGTSPRQWFTVGSSDTSQLTPRAAQARPGSLPAAPKEQPELVKEALAALDRHQGMIRHRDRVAVVDFSAPSSKPRLQILDVASGKTTDFLVAHGSGSDPGHTGFLQRFSNEPNSNASSKGAFVTANYYVGKHGRSQRLLGLDPTNNNALDRAIVLHGAWYANADMIPAHGKLGRSQGCFAVGERELARVFDLMGEGRMIYAARA